MLADQVAKLRQRRTAPLILELDLSDGLGEERPADPVSAVLARRRLVLADVLDGLRRARNDQRVKALIAKVGGRPIGLAMVQELRRAIEEFRDAGKLTVAWAESFGEFSAGNVPYYLATAFETIYLQPSGDLGLTGVAVERRFFRDAMDRLGVEFQVAKRHEYKSAAEQLTETGFTQPAREATERITESVTGQLASAIAERRRIAPERVRELIDRGPFLAAQALQAGLVDELGYRDEVYASVRKQAGQDAIIQYVSRYQRSRVLAERARKLPARLPASRERSVALIYATGPIRRGRSGRGPLSGGAMGSDTIAGALRSAVADEQIRAIVLRVNSPGGSYVASDTIWREVVRASAEGKPVVVSMGDVAASGGYFISMAADAIVAQPGHGHRLDRRAVRQAGGQPPARPDRGDDRLDHRRRPRGHVQHQPPVQRGRMGAGQRLARSHLRRLHRQGRGRPRAVRRAGARAGQGPGVDRRRRARARAGRRDRRPGPGRGDRPQPGGPAQVRAAARVPESQADRPVAPAVLQRQPVRRAARRKLGTGLAAGGPGRLAAVRAADPARQLDI